MWLSGFLILPVIFASAGDLKRVRYHPPAISNDVLMEVPASTELNMTHQSIDKILDDAFADWGHLISLDLSSNNIRKIEPRAFAKLTNLEYLSLADNDFSELGEFSARFAELRNLKILNLTNNRHLTHFRRHLFAGLGASCDIITKGIPIQEINTDVFKPDSYPDRMPQFINDYYNPTFGRVTGSLSMNNRPGPLDSNLRIKVCIERGTVTTFDVLIASEILASGCREVTIVHYANEVHARSMGITSFAKGWYRLQDYQILNIDFEDNEIARITPELLNDLPSSVRALALQRNKIERVEIGTMDNAHLRVLVLRSNRVNFVEDGAFEKLSKIANIFLDKNELRDMNFVATLPTSLEQLYLGYNEITGVPSDKLSKFNRLFNLELQNNKIKRIERRSFGGLASLEQLRLANNRLETIDRSFSQDLKALRLFDVSNNSITSLEAGTFSGFEQINAFDLTFNKLTRLPKGLFREMPDTLKYIWLDHNEIERLEEETFSSNGSMWALTLRGNRITDIERGTFDLPKLQALNLADNLLSEFDGDTFQGLQNLVQLNLNNNRIAKVKTATKNLRKLGGLDLSNNLFKRLDKDSLVGMLISRFVNINVRNTPIELLNSGVFGEQ